MAFSFTPQEVCGHTVGVAFAEGKSVEGAESAEQSKATLRVGKYSFASNLAPL